MASFNKEIAKKQSHDGVVAGTKAAGLAAIVTAIPTVAIARMLPWGRANLNYTAQALVISTDELIVAGAAYFIVADKTILASARAKTLSRTMKQKTEG